MAPERGLKDLATAQQLLAGTTQNLNIPDLDHKHPKPSSDLQYPKGRVLCGRGSLQFHLLKGFSQCRKRMACEGTVNGAM